MTERPTLTTSRLVLRPFVAADASAVQTLAGEKEIAAMTVNIPHPYERAAAKKWIAGQSAAFARDEHVVFATTERRDGTLVGAMGLELTLAHARAELGYWIGKPFWNKGYATEAASAVLRYGFEERSLNRIQATVFVDNAASTRVLTKIGMRHEGLLRQHFKKWGRYMDVEAYAILRDEYRRGGS